MICRVLNDHGWLPPTEAKLFVLATEQTIDAAPVIYIRPFNADEFMQDIDNASLDLLGDGPLMSAAGTWVAAQRSQADTEPTAKTLPPGRS
ncbi:hypothetical protein [Kitasatospora sp. NPDC088351]|uniref:hypothetical protein n=1 Tax=Kitasatospora sp. NPDC088351 TaxID=3155180 RepID=UPI0034247871